MDNEIVERGRALLAQPVAPEPPTIEQLLGVLIERITALELAVCAPRTRIPVRDPDGKIIAIHDTMEATDG